ncbi:MAG TPA: UDP-N-acetylglucosamine--N-acetylmuramyl-(pentapeptide) pyrophosphoryl-undecaprenol N-acetylglucosamine transferase [Candidatus Paceibacterota bacterium]|nr:UDP-N-acetylglucosamine--N-acetylmuramyl-(pentapeptide) pyrophosphoryl-undecaprenol N-acetylglucosamine transferase [Candidatus Paceibacterota bacterium]
MKIVLTGGGTGGHFYPLIAVAEGIEELCNERRLVEPRLFYFGPAPFDPTALAEHDIEHVAVGAASVRKDARSSAFGYIGSLFSAAAAFPKVFSIYPDVIFSTGGYAAFPTLLCAKILRIPVVIYDADAKPGRVSLWSAKFARWIAVAHPDAAASFPEKLKPRMARTGHPIRREIENPAHEGGHEFLKLDPSLPTIFIVGGSQGARAINETVLDALPMLLEKYNVVHQVGTNNLTEVQGIASVSLRDSPYRERYRIFGLLNALALKMTAGIASLVLSRAGSGSIFEIASWGIPAILVPISLDVSHDQTENAFSYARAGGCIVIEQRNLTPHVLVAEIDRLMGDTTVREKMKKAAKSFSRPQAGKKIAQILLETALEHEPK